MSLPLAELTAQAQALAAAGDLTGARAILDRALAVPHRHRAAHTDQADQADADQADADRAGADQDRQAEHTDQGPRSDAAEHPQHTHPVDPAGMTGGAAGPGAADAVARAEAAALHARVLLALGDAPTAHRWAQQAHSVLTRVHGPADERVIAATVTHAAVLHRVGRHNDARRWYRTVIDQLTQLDGPDSDRVLAAEADLATVEHVAGACAVARTRLADAWQRHQAGNDRSVAAGIKMLARLGAMERDCGRPAEARELLQQAQRLCREHLGAGHALTGQVDALADAPASPAHRCGDTVEPDHRGLIAVRQPAPPAHGQPGVHALSSATTQLQPIGRPIPEQRRAPGDLGQPSDGPGDPSQPNDGPGDPSQPNDGPGDAGQPSDGPGDAGQPGDGQPDVVRRPDDGDQSGDQGQPGGGQPGIDRQPGDIVRPGALVLADDPRRSGNAATDRIRQRRNLIVATALLAATGGGAAAVIANLSPADQTPPAASTAVGAGPVGGATAAQSPTANRAAGATPPAEVRRSTPGPPAPAAVAIRDNRDSVMLTWRYPAAVEGPVLISGGRRGQEQRAFQQLPAGSENYVVYGLNERADYCFTVAVVYSVDTVAASDPVCTARASAPPG